MSWYEPKSARLPNDGKRDRERASSFIGVGRIPIFIPTNVYHDISSSTEEMIQIDGGGHLSYLKIKTFLGVKFLKF